MRCFFGGSACLVLLGVSAIASAQVQVAAQAGTQVGTPTQDRKKPCAADDKCIPTDIAVWAPLELRVGRWDLEGTSRSYEPTQFTVGLNPDMTLYAAGGTARTRIQANLGGGTSGFEWNLGGIWMFGGRLNVGQGENGGLFARLGADGYLGGNSDFYHSHLELPRFELGYQLLKVDKLFIEVAGRGGLMLVGRHRVFDRTRDIGFSMDAGGFLTVQMAFLRVELDAVRIFEEANAPETPMDRAQADLCGVLSRFALCVTGSSDRAEISSNGEAVDTHANFLGVKLSGGDAAITTQGL